MYRFILRLSLLCFLCYAILWLVIVANRRLMIEHRVDHSMRSSGESDILADTLTVYDALVGDSYEIFVSDARTGQQRQLTAHIGNDRFPALSPTGDQVAFVSWRDGNSEIYIINLQTGTLFNLSNHQEQDILPVWSPHGNMLAYTARREDQYDIYVADVSRRLTQNLTKNPVHDSQPAWLPDNQGLIYASYRNGQSMRYHAELDEGNVIRLERKPNGKL